MIRPGEEAKLALAERRAPRKERGVIFKSAAIAIAGAGAVGLSILVAPDRAGLFGGALALLMLAIALIDARSFIIPDTLTIAAFLLALAKALGQELARNELGGAPEGFDVAAFGAPILRGIVVASAFLGLREIYRRLRGRQGIGLGDVKLAAVAGAWLDWMMIPIAIEIAALTALAAYAIGQFILRRPFSATARLPFGLFFGPAIWFGWVIQAWLLAV